MSEELENGEVDKFGSDYLTIEDEEGNEYELELIETLEFEGATYLALLPTDIEEGNADYGIVLLKTIVEDGEELLATIDDDDEQERVYTYYMEMIFAEDDDDDGDY